MKARRALLSVSDKTGIIELARGLAAAGIELLSTGGTHRLLIEAGLTVREVADHTGFPEMMDGRVKTLHPKIHGGILGRRHLDAEVMKANQIAPIDLVVVNLYPFVQTIARVDVTDEIAIENIDIGGPAMVRSAAKNHLDVLVVVDPNDYAQVLSMVSGPGIHPDAQRRFAAKAFRYTAQYDAVVSNYLSRDEPFPESITLTWNKLQDMRYGENPHQAGAFYREVNAPVGTVATLEQLQGKELSYNNVADADAALECVKVFTDCACVIVKHANPCGVAIGKAPLDAYERAYATDPTSAFGGIIAFNQPLDGATLAVILEQQFVEVVIAPEIHEDAVAIARAKKNVRLLACGHWAGTKRGRDFKRVGGGLLLQEADELCVSTEGLTVVSQRSPSASEMADLEFAWRVCWFVKSNAIVYARNKQTIGVGAGQMSRVVSAKIAALKAQEEGLEVHGSVMASDAFFTFRDGIDSAAAAGITAVIQPGGSMRDAEVIAAADEHGMAMVFTSVRHFRH